ncbi:MAG: isoaspartyl peptidase/L-asparaginase [Elusimicrobiota bacterium]
MAYFRVLTHGGSSSRSEWSDGTLAAAETCVRILERGQGPGAAAAAAVADMEADRRFNAGLGSSLRADGKTIQMDAALMSSGEAGAPDFGAVVCLERIRNPIRAAEALSEGGLRILCGPGALSFARARGLPEGDQSTDEARRRFEETEPVSDTVGCVATDGTRFAAALSSGGLTRSPLGRVGDVPLPGCGLYAGSWGAVAFTGIGEEIARRHAALRAYRLLEEGLEAEAVLSRVRDWFGEIEFGCLILGRRSEAAGSNRDMAWSAKQA